MNLTGVRPMFASDSLRLLGFGGACLALLFAAGCGKEQKAQATPPPTVEATEVVQKDVPIYTEWVGSTDGLVNATIRAQVTGYLIKQNYTEGDLVRKGQVLFEIDPRTFQAALEQAKGALAQAEGAVGHRQGQPGPRIKPLAEKNAVSQKDLDDAIGAELSTHAARPSAPGALDKAQAGPGLHQDHLADRRHRRHRQGPDRQPGRPGQHQELTTVSTVDPIKVYFPSASRNI